MSSESQTKTEEELERDEKARQYIVSKLIEHLQLTTLWRRIIWASILPGLGVFALEVILYLVAKNYASEQLIKHIEHNSVGCITVVILPVIMILMCFIQNIQDVFAKRRQCLNEVKNIATISHDCCLELKLAFEKDARLQKIQTPHLTELFANCKSQEP